MLATEYILQSHVCPSWYTQSHSRTGTHAYKHTVTQSHSSTDTHAHRHKDTLWHRHSQCHTHTHTHIHTHTHTQCHTHTHFTGIQYIRSFGSIEWFIKHACSLSMKPNDTGRELLIDIHFFISDILYPLPQCQCHCHVIITTYTSTYFSAYPECMDTMRIVPLTRLHKTTQKSDCIWAFMPCMSPGRDLCVASCACRYEHEHNDCDWQTPADS
jgi:hypothetical protein